MSKHEFNIGDPVKITDTNGAHIDVGSVGIIRSNHGEPHTWYGVEVQGRTWYFKPQHLEPAPDAFACRFKPGDRVVNATGVIEGEGEVVAVNSIAGYPHTHLLDVIINGNIWVFQEHQVDFAPPSEQVDSTLSKEEDYDDMYKTLVSPEQKYTVLYTERDCLRVKSFESETAMQTWVGVFTLKEKSEDSWIDMVFRGTQIYKADYIEE